MKMRQYSAEDSVHPSLQAETVENLQLRWPSNECVRLSSGRLGFDSESGQTNDFKIGIHCSIPA